MRLKLDLGWLSLEAFMVMGEDGEIRYVPNLWAIPGGGVATTSRVLLWARENGIQVKK